MTRGAVVAVLGAASLLFPSVGDGSLLLDPAPGALLVPGQQVQIRWLDPTADVDEMELLLLLGPSSRRAVRLTPQLEPGTRSYLWTVPNLPAEEARLILRTGRDGHEEEDEPGPPFRIVSTDRSTLEHLGHVRGEWWTRGHHHTPIAPLGMAESRTLVQSLMVRTPAILRHLFAFDGLAGAASPNEGPSAISSANPPAFRPRDRQPQDYPLRP